MRSDGRLLQISDPAGRGGPAHGKKEVPPEHKKPVGEGGGFMDFSKLVQACRQRGKNLGEKTKFFWRAKLPALRAKKKRFFENARVAASTARRPRAKRFTKVKWEGEGPERVENGRAKTPNHPRLGTTQKGPRGKEVRAAQAQRRLWLRGRELVHSLSVLRKGDGRIDGVKEKRQVGPEE